MNVKTLPAVPTLPSSLVDEVVRSTTKTYGSGANYGQPSLRDRLMATQLGQDRRRKSDIE